MLTLNDGEQKTLFFYLWQMRTAYHKQRGSLTQVANWAGKCLSLLDKAARRADKQNAKHSDNANQ